jgi:hypothetical protein
MRDRFYQENRVAGPIFIAANSIAANSIAANSIAANSIAANSIAACPAGRDRHTGV